MILYVLILLISTLLQHGSSQVLQINCLNADNSFTDPTPTTCGDYILQYLESYTGNSPNNPAKDLPDQGYDSSQIPLPSLNSGPSMFNQGNGRGINVYALVELVDMVDIDTSQGIVVVNLNLNLLWSDYRLAWNSSLAPGIPFVYIDPNYIWTPDITLYNQASGSTILDSPVQLYPHGTAWLRRQAYLMYNCEFELQKFPFDVQSCPLDFASWMYPDLLLNLEIYSSQFSSIPRENMLISPSFRESISWKTLSFVPSNYSVQTMYGNFKHIIYTVTCSRYASYYMYTAVMPEIIVTVITLIALWIPDINSRMAISVTTLLMVVAIMWTVSAGLPLTEESTWMEQFSTLCTVIIAVCCFENAMVAYIQSKARAPPKWLKYFILASNFFSIAYLQIKYFLIDNCSETFCIYYGKVFPIPKRRKNGDQSQDDNKNVTDIEMSSPHKSKIQNGGDKDDDDRPRLSNYTTNPIIDSAKSAEQGQQSDDRKNNETSDLNDNDDSPLLGSESNEFSWAQVGRAIDRLSRLVLPMSFMIGAIKLVAMSRS